MNSKRKYPFGAEVIGNGVDFSVWVQNSKHVELKLDGNKYLMQPQQEGIFSLFVDGAKEGMRYTFTFNGLELPDPASRLQPEGISSPSAIFDTKKFEWKDCEWKGVSSLKGQVIYELHIGTFTKEGTWLAAIEKLSHLADLGVTLIEMMPISEFYGKFGWGYDGIYLFAPYHIYGSPNDLKEFIEKAHLLGIGVILDVVYNHFGPHRELHRHFSPDYFHADYTTDWGDALNYDGSHAKFVRSFVISNVHYWIEEYHFDGVRIDAAQDIHDTSEKHILQELKESLAGRNVLIIAESETQNSALIKKYQLDGVWNDDFHHVMRVALTGDREAYYCDYKGSLQEILSTIKYGYLYQGQYYSWQSQCRGTPSLDIGAENYVVYLENHDQVANSTTGRRLHQLANPSLYRALTTLFLLTPQAQLLFQGQEFGSASPFYFFGDHDPGMGKTVWAGRREFLLQWPSFKSLNLLADYPDPCSEETFLRCKLNWDSYSQEVMDFHKTVIALKKKDPTFSNPCKVDGALLHEDVLLIRYFGKEGNDRLVICNCGADFKMKSISEPLFAPPLQKTWDLLFSSRITHPKMEGEEWTLPAYTTYILKPGKS